jgi:hypothetical protein
MRLGALLLNPRAAHRRRLLTRLVQFAERWVEYIIFCMAAHRLGPRKPRKWAIFRRPGFRVARGSNRLLWKSARIKLRNASLIARVIRLIEALTRPERYCAHYMRKLARGLCFRRLIPCAPPATLLISAETRDVAIADSS